MTIERVGYKECEHCHSTNIHVEGGYYTPIPDDDSLGAWNPDYLTCGNCGEGNYGI